LSLLQHYEVPGIHHQVNPNQDLWEILPYNFHSFDLPKIPLLPGKRIKLPWFGT
jgi:hypothetical protein